MYDPTLLTSAHRPDHGGAWHTDHPGCDTYTRGRPPCPSQGAGGQTQHTALHHVSEVTIDKTCKSVRVMGNIVRDNVRTGDNPSPENCLVLQVAADYILQ